MIQMRQISKIVQTQTLVGGFMGTIGHYWDTPWRFLCKMRDPGCRLQRAQFPKPCLRQVAVCRGAGHSTPVAKANKLPLESENDGV